MLEQDYIKRIIQQFFEMLSTTLLKYRQGELPFERVHQEFVGLCNRYTEDDLDALLREPCDEFTDYIRRVVDMDDRECACTKLTVVSELLHHEAMMRRDGDIASRALVAMEMLNATSHTLSLTRVQRMDALRELCENETRKTN